ncbi:isopenicillin N synthase family dioxygenase [Flavilitoribacter nigricans]|uniref:2-oxoglutarate-dependent ethylene/succinate-forming enzyme n=1 Tax=Flavilitoribacter nigricans (strain ATCC 23147 / DSM 23189 / NBRC 102662 / NCIMB 1420 / SS-2) TaxID=1122177 RepID=A0A2D0MYX5_FLAN2|nr:2-oxoglutarate and iron-dependent oxygenase domain-containing protein [Flavilitoribacter nigricans]PHN01338.1 iron oxidase [Flavilitoribacter nigricans DSM 23189 = NBRC 102662]
MKNETTPSVPLIDISELIRKGSGQSEVARQIGSACREYGFFYIAGHGISTALQEQLEALSHDFFNRPESEKMRIRMELGGRAWRGYFPLGDELTSGKPDLKEGIYFGEELPEEDERVQAKIPLHGANLFPEAPDSMRQVVLEYIRRLTELGHHLMRGIALSLDLDEHYFSDRYTADPLVLFRIFHYPSREAHAGLDAPWGVGEHTDYGVLTILKQDHIGGLQVKTQDQWIEAPYIPNTFVCNIGDMLDRMTGGRYRSTPHRVLNRTSSGRFSFPFFFDPNFSVRVEPIDLEHLGPLPEKHQDRWDGADVHAFEGSYGDYILHKVSKVFPQLKRAVD